MPFELPYMLLHENLDLWLRINYKDKYEEMQKEIFLFSHRNPTNVLQSEIIYTMLSNIKSKQQYREWIHAHHKRVLITKASFRAYDGIKFKTSKTKKEFKATYNRNGKFKRLNDKVKVARYLKIYSLQKNVTSLEMEVQTEDVKKYAIDMSNMEIERLLYDCNTGRILGKIAGNSNEDTNRVNLEGLHLYAPILHGEMIGAKRSLIKDAYAVFHYQNNIYMERLIELTYQEKKHWKKEELYDYFFRVPTPYKDIINSLFPIKKKSPEDDNTLFVYDQKKEEYSWQTPQVFSVFFVPRLALEAFVSLPQIAYTDMFFEHDTELVNKVKRIISRGHLEGECSWNIGDIEYLNRHACEEKNGYSIHSLLRRYRMNGCIYDKTREKYYYMLRLEYSVAKERVRVLGQEIGGEEKLTLIDSSNIEYKNCREFSRENLMKARRNYVEKVQNYKGVMQFKLEKSIEQLSVAMDHILSKDWMNLLASYEHETNYEFPEDKKDASEEKKRKFGIYEVKLWYWKEDEDEVVEELKKFNSVFKMVDDEPNIL